MTLSDPLENYPEELAAAIITIRSQPSNIFESYNAYVVIGYYYAIAKDQTRREKRGSPGWQEAKKKEDILESLVLAAKEAIWIIKHLDKHGGID